MGEHRGSIKGKFYHSALFSSFQELSIYLFDLQLVFKLSAKSGFPINDKIFNFIENMLKVPSDCSYGWMMVGH